MEIYKNYLVAILLLYGGVCFVNAKFYSEAIARDRLRKELFTNYNPNIRPGVRGKRLDLAVHLELQHFNFRGSFAFEFFGKLFVSWSDQKLRWSPKDYKNISQLYVPQLTIWIPDLEIYNNAPDKFIRMHDRGLVLVESNGRVTWSDTIEVNAFCESQASRWPNDRHYCKLRLGSWTYDGNLVNFDKTTPNSSKTTEHIAKNPEFKLLNHTIGFVNTVYSCCEESYVTLDYDLEFERRASFAIIFKMPALCVILLTLGAFCMEPHRGEKLLLNGISILLSVFQLIYFAKNVTLMQSVRNIPMCVNFYCISLILVTFAMMLSVFSLWASGSKNKSRLPPGFLKLLQSRIGSLLDSHPTHGLKPMNEEEMQAQFEDVKLQENSDLTTKEISPDEWTRFAFVIERISFLTFSLIFLVLASICFM